jgi:hypothetical protein
VKYYRVHTNHGVTFVKEEAFFRFQGGLTAQWGRAWRRVRTRSIEHARKIGQHRRMGNLDWRQRHHMWRLLER